MNQMGLKIRIMDGLVWVVEKGLGNGGLLIVLIQGATFVGGILKNIARIANAVQVTFPLNIMIQVPQFVSNSKLCH